MKVKVDAGTCTGCGVCSDGCPEVFKLNDDSISEVIVDVVPPEAEERCRTAVADCPVTCIEMQEG